MRVGMECGSYVDSKYLDVCTIRTLFSTPVYKCREYWTRTARCLLPLFKHVGFLWCNIGRCLFFFRTCSGDDLFDLLSNIGLHGINKSTDIPSSGDVGFHPFLIGHEGP